MAGTTVDIDEMIEPHVLATEITSRWNKWNQARQNKIEEWKELRNYLYATDTRTTSNSKLPWTNSTTTPKLTQIADNLHANYFSALFPQKRWFRFEANDADSNTKAKRDVIQAYMSNKVRQSDFENTVSRLISDYIQYGNCFATVDFVRDYSEYEDGDVSVNYVGPKLVRISPFDICFNPLAPSFENSPKVVRTVMTLGEVARKVQESSDNGYLSSILQKMIDNRAAMSEVSVDISKSQAYIADGFSSLKEYYESNYVELLTFYGDGTQQVTLRHLLFYRTS